MNPTLDDVAETSVNIKLKRTLVVFLIYLTSAIFVFIFLGLLDTFIVEYFFNHSILDQLKLNNQQINTDFGRYSFIVVVLVAPIFEEIIFRLPLKLGKVGISITAGLICYRLLAGRLFASEFYDLYSYLKIAIALIFSLITFKFLPASWLVAMKANYKYFFYSVAVIFALVHLSNFSSFNYSVLLFYPFFTLPQFLMGLLIGYVRVEYGFLYGIALHSMINLPAFLISL